MGEQKRLGSADLRGSRRWSFADCIFDESDWALTVGGRRVAIETKPLELLRQLLLHAQHLVSKDALMDAVWPNVAVVEASLPTAVRKLRLALGDDDRPTHLIETVPRIGYRLAVPATLEGALVQTPPVTPPFQPAASNGRRLWMAGGALAVVVLTVLLVAPSEHVAATKASRVYSSSEAVNALRRLDVAKVDQMIADGWKPDALDKESNNALNRLLEICEWNPAHDRAKLLTISRALLDGGVSIIQRNIYGDTAYSIAKAQRYCGPNHPVTIMLRNMCYSGEANARRMGDRCLAAYELARHQS